MNVKQLPLAPDRIEALARQFPTPFHLYDEAAILQNVRRLKTAFTWNPGFREYFAVKATPNPYILKLLAAEGLGADCSSAPELTLAERVGLKGNAIMFTSNDTPADEYKRAIALGALINLDDISHIAFLRRHAGIPETLCFRYNPGPLKQGNAIIGHPEEAKYGFTRQQLFDGYRQAASLGVKRFGLHAMVASNELDPAYFIETADMLFRLVSDLNRETGLRFDFVNMGGGIGIPYHPSQKVVDLEAVGAGVKQSYERWIRATGLDPVQLYLECGRLITGPYGWLITRVLHIKHTYKTFVGLDACMADLMRPGMYGAYHHITLPGKPANAPVVICDVTGSLCENNDKFAIDRELPEACSGDLVVIHDTGAHGHAMGFNYNGKLRHAEILLRPDGSVMQIRRPESEDDLFATLDFNGLAEFGPMPI